MYGQYWNVLIQIVEINDKDKFAVNNNIYFADAALNAYVVGDAANLTDGS